MSTFSRTRRNAVPRCCPLYVLPVSGPDAYANWSSLAPEQVPSTIPIQWNLLPPVTPRGYVIDIGSGPRSRSGRMPGTSIAVDINNNVVRSAVASRPSLAGVVADALGLPLRSAIADLAIVNATLNAVSPGSRRGAALREVVRVLAPSGLAYVADAVREDDGAYLVRYAEAASLGYEYGTVISRDLDGAELYCSYHFADGELRSSCERAGLRVLREHHGSAFSRTGNALRYSAFVCDVEGFREDA